MTYTEVFVSLVLRKLWLMASVCRESPITLLGYQLISVTFLRSKAFSLEGGIDLADGVSQSSKLLKHRHHQCLVCLGRLNSASNHLTKCKKFLQAFPKACSICMKWPCGTSIFLPYCQEGNWQFSCRRCCSLKHVNTLFEAQTYM